MMRKIISYFVQVIGILGIVALTALIIVLQFFPKFGNPRDMSPDLLDKVWSIASPYLFFIILIVAGWYFRRGAKHAKKET